MSKIITLESKIEYFRDLLHDAWDIVDFYTDGNYKIILKDEYRWFLSDEFKRYWTNSRSLHTPKNSASQQTLDAEKKGVSWDQEGTVRNTDTLDYNNEVHN
jgi:hypothetical protein